MLYKAKMGWWTPTEIRNIEGCFSRMDIDRETLSHWEIEEDE